MSELHPALFEKKGQELGVGEWLEITQERVDQFADATDDHQWIHTDPERASDGPYGGTIGHGFLTLALVLLTALVVLAAGLAVAGRGDIFNTAFLNHARTGQQGQQAGLAHAVRTNQSDHASGRNIQA